MEDSSASDAGAQVSYDALGSLLGVKGPIRLVPQGSTPKAHVVIKRDYVKERPDSGESSTSIARFSFIAGKKFTVNKGQPLLFAVASPTDRDGKTLLCDDNTFLLEADVMNIAGDNNEDDAGLPASEKKERGRVDGLPPKMRKSFARKKSYASFIENEPPSSIGFLGYPLGAPAARVYTSASVQTDPHASPSLQTMETVHTPRIPLSVMESVEKSPVQLPSPVSADHAREPTSESLAQIEGEEMDDLSRTERSLSPMDLSSASCSPVSSPPLKQDPLPEEVTPGLQTKDVSPPTPPPPTSPTPPLPSIPLPSPPSPPASVVTSIEPSTVLPCVSKSEVASLQTTVSDKTILEDVTLHISSTSIMSRTTPSLSEISSPRPRENGLKDNETQDEPNFIDEVQNEPKFIDEIQNEPKIAYVRDEPISDISKSVDKPAERDLSQQEVTVHEELVSSARTSSATPNAVASSSKRSSDWSTIERDSAIRREGIPFYPRAMRQALSQENSVAASSGKSLLPTPTSMRNSTIPTQSRSPPPEPKILAYIPSGSSTNPLGIRPSSGRVLPLSSQKSVPTGPRSLVVVGGPPPATQAPRKPIVVGAKWSAARSSGSSSNASNTSVSASASSSSMSSSSPTVHTPSSATAGLSHIMRYASPSPPPPPHPDHPPPMPPIPPHSGLAKWKRISCVDEKQANVPSNPESSNRLTDTINDSTSLSASGSSLKRPRDSFAEDDPRQSEIFKGPSPKKARSISPLSTPSTLQSQSTLLSNDLNSSLLKLPPSIPPVAKTATTPPKVPQPLTHPLPPKPVATASSYRPPPTKRERSLEPLESKRPSPRTDWPATLSSANYQLQSSRAGVNVGIQRIVFNSDGTQIAIICADRTLRVWENKQPAAEVARLSHNSAIVFVHWMQSDVGLLTLTADGTVIMWTRHGKEWKFTKLFVIPDVALLDIPVCMAYAKDRIAVTTPAGVKVWILNNGSWQSQRDIVRSGVTAIRFVFNGDALIGGCRDGVLWYSEVPNGTLRVHVLFPSKKPITSIDLPPTGSYLLVAQEGGQSHLVTLKPNENKGSIERTYTSEKLQSLRQKGFPAVFATRGQAVLYGTVNGCALVWDRKKGVIVYGLKHPEGDPIQAAATFDGRPGVEGLMVTGTTQGRLFWWPQPVAAAPTHSAAGSTPDASQRKRTKG